MGVLILVLENAYKIILVFVLKMYYSVPQREIFFNQSNDNLFK